MKEQTVDATIAAVGNKINAGGLGFSGFGWLTSNEFAILAGVFIALMGMLINWYYKRKELQAILEFKNKEHGLHERESALRIKYEERRYTQLEEEHIQRKGKQV
jgi:hypothetical protein